MGNLKKFLTPQGAQALREFAAAMPAAVENIIQCTEKLTNVYRSTAEDLGAHSDSFAEMIGYIKKAQEAAAEAIEELPKGLEVTALKIDDYLAKKNILNTQGTNINGLTAGVATQKYRASHNNQQSNFMGSNITRTVEKDNDLRLRENAHDLLRTEQYSRSTWQNASIEKKEAMLSSLVGELNGILGTCVPENIEYFYEESSSRGAYVPSENKVHINKYFLEKTSSYQITQTLIHEMRHAYQYYAIKNPDKVKISQDTIDAWTENIKNYKSPEYGYTYEEYIAQPIEWDAKNFAKQLTDIMGINPTYSGSWDL